MPWEYKYDGPAETEIKSMKAGIPQPAFLVWLRNSCAQAYPGIGYHMQSQVLSHLELVIKLLQWHMRWRQCPI
jgi:hypothetical protein